MRSLLMLLTLSLLVACGGDDDDQGGGATNPSCTVTATLAEGDNRALEVVGKVTCQQSTTIELETCLQSDDAAEGFADLTCQSGLVSNLAMFSNGPAVSCAAMIGHQFRVRVSATVGGKTLPETLSTVIVCE